MQADSIIEKAKKLGIDVGNGINQVDKLRYIAEQVGVDDLQELEETLDSMLNNNIDTLDDLQDIESLDTNYSEPIQRRERFGEREYNAAKNEHGIYDKNYYANRGKELDDQVAHAEEKKNQGQKEVLKKNEQGEKTPVQKNKNIFDKAKDNAELMKAKNDRVLNKINSAKAKAYNVMHPGEALKNQAKAAVSNAAKTAGKKVGKSAVKAGAAAGKAIGKAALTGAKLAISFLMKNPVVLIILGVVLFIFIIIILFSTTGSNDKYLGLYGYEYIEPKCTEITISSGEYAGIYDIEEYVAGVVQAEVGGFIGGSWNEAAKAGAVAARSFVQANVDDSCTVISSQSFQVYKTPSDSAIQIAHETRGLVLVENGNIKSTQYDAFCTKSPQDDPNNYIVCQQNQRIPRSWVDSQTGIADSWKSGTMSGAHGNGMSQWGAAYLAEQGYSFEEILAFYYDNAELMSIYPSFLISNNWTQEISTNSTSTISTTIMRTPINELLTKSQYNELNEFIYDSVMDVGVGTRSAVIAAAVTPIKFFAEYYNVVIPYTLGGGHYMSIYSNATGENIQKTTTTYYGVDPDWGTIISHTWDGSYYDEYGPDCSSWVPWVFHNAGISIGPRLAGDFVNLGTKHSMNSGYIAQPGDILENDHHVTVVVGVDEANELYYIAHASGGNYGTIITPVSFSSSSYYIVEMTEYIENHKIETYETDYMNGVLEY